MTRITLQYLKRLKGFYLTFAVLGGVLLFSTQAQAVSYALTGFTYDTGAGMVYGTSQTYLDYDLDAYYNAGTDGYLIKYNDASLSSYTVLESGGVNHPWDAVVLTAANVQRGETYAVFSDHFLETTLYYYGYPYDPYGISYNYFGEGGGSPYYGFQYGQSVVMQNVWFYLGRTGVIVSLPDITQLAPDAGVPGTTPTVQIIGKYIGEHIQIPPTVTVSGNGVTAQFANFLPNGIEVSLQIAEDADVGDHTLNLTSDGVLSNSVNFRVGDRSPQITGISPADGITGEQVAVTITGTGFGTNPQIQIDGSGINPQITSATPTEIQAIFSIADLTYDGNRSITIRSSGRAGSGFMSVPGNSPVSNEVTFGVKSPKVTIPEIGSVEKGAVKTIQIQIENASAQNHVTKLSFKNQPPLSGDCPADGCKTGEAKFVDDAGNDVTEISIPGTGEAVAQRAVRIRGLERSSSNNNIKLEARFNNEANVKKDRSFSVSSIIFIENDECTGYDDVEFQRTGNFYGRYLYIPKGGSSKLRMKVVPSGATGAFRLEPTEAGITLSQTTVSGGSEQLVTVNAASSVDNNPGILVKADNTDALTNYAESLTIEAMPAKAKTVVIYAVTEDNDDIQVTASRRIDQNNKNYPVNSNPGGVGEISDHGSNPRWIYDGSKAIDRFNLSASDENPLDASTVCVSSGPNQFLDTVVSSQDVEATDPANPALKVILAGSDGDCDSDANDKDIAPPGVLTNAASAESFRLGLQEYLNNAIWAKQANLSITVSPVIQVLERNFDLNRDKKLEVPDKNVAGSSNELSKLLMNQTPPTGTYNLYFTGTEFTKPTVLGFASTPGYFGIFNHKTFDTDEKHTIAHELGHMFGSEHTSDDKDTIEIQTLYLKDLMFYGQTAGVNQCRVRQPQWDKIRQL